MAARFTRLDVIDGHMAAASRRLLEWVGVACSLSLGEWGLGAAAQVVRQNWDLLEFPCSEALFAVLVWEIQRIQTRILEPNANLIAPLSGVAIWFLSFPKARPMA